MSKFLSTRKAGYRVVKIGGRYVVRQATSSTKHPLSLSSAQKIADKRNGR